MDETLFSGNVVTSNRILYTPSVFAKTNLLHLQEVGELRALKPHDSKRENLSSFLFFLVTEGFGTLSYNGVSYPLTAGDCVFLDCRKSYTHHSSEDLWTLKWVHFYGPNMNGIYEKYLERGGLPVFHAASPAVYDELLTRLLQLASSPAYTKDMKIYEKLTSLLTRIMEESWNPRQAHSPGSRVRDLQDIKDYLDQHYREKILLDQLSEMFFINKFYLTRVYKQQFGISVNSYLLQLRITHAKQLLRFTDYSIERIGQECGMSDANYFSRMFRKIEGITPGGFRKMWTE